MEMEVEIEIEDTEKRRENFNMFGRHEDEGRNGKRKVLLLKFL